MGAEVHELHSRTGSRKERGRGLETEANRLVSAYSDLILRVSYTYLHSTHDAQDIAQQVFMKLLTGGYGFRDAEHERAWIVRSTINACKDLLRSAARRTTVDLDEATWLEAPHQEHGDVLEAVNELPGQYREAIYLYYYEGYSIREIAELTDSSEAAITKRLSRAREALRELLGPDSYGADGARLEVRHA